MKRFLIFFLLILFFYISYSDELHIYQNKNADYIQTEEFLVADGTSVLGPIKLLPFAITEYLKVQPSSQNIKIKAILLEKAYKDWKKSIIGKNISLEGGGRFIKGKVKAVDKNYIIIDTSRGTIITTLPDFPERLTSILKWDELFSPYILLKIDSTFSGNSTFDISYQLENINWIPVYIYNQDKKSLDFFIRIVNHTNINLNSVNIFLHTKDKLILSLKEANLEANSTKIIKVKTLKTLDRRTILSLPDGKVGIYSKNSFVGERDLRHLFK